MEIIEIHSILLLFFLSVLYNNHGIIKSVLCTKKDKTFEQQCSCTFAYIDGYNTISCILKDGNHNPNLCLTENAQIIDRFVIQENGFYLFQKKSFHEVFSSVEMLDISNNEDDFVVTISFLSIFSKLHSLRLYNCNIVDIEYEAFKGSPHLKVIDLAMNSKLSFEQVTSGLMNNELRNLKVLNVSGIYNLEDRPTVSIGAHFFRNLANTSLEVLDISWTRLNLIEDSFLHLPNLKVLNMSGTFIIGYTNCIAALIKLKYLEVITMDHWPVLVRGQESIVSTVDSKFLFKRSTDTCPPMEYINASTGCINAKEIRTLQLRFITMDTFFWDFSNHTCYDKDNKLTNLVLSGSKTSKQVGPLVDFKHLKLLDASYLESAYPGPIIKSSFVQDIPLLEILLLPGLKIGLFNDTELASFISRNTNLRILDIAYNGITVIPRDTFKQNILLEHINISGNSLTTFDVNLAMNIHLQSIDLENNKLKTLGYQFLESLQILNSLTIIDVYLKSNLIECSCEILRASQLYNVRMSLKCEQSDKLYDLSSSKNSSNSLEELCQSKIGSAQKLLIILSVIGGSIVIVCVVLIRCYFLRRKNDNLQNKEMCIVNYNRNEKPKYIVFFSYCSDDENIVIGTFYDIMKSTLSKQFEHKGQEDSLILLGDRHFKIGEFLDDCIVDAVKNSYVVVCFISDAFIKSEWCKKELHYANLGQVPIIPVYLERCNTDAMTGILKYIFNTRARLCWFDKSEPEDNAQSVNYPPETIENPAAEASHSEKQCKELTVHQQEIISKLCDRIAEHVEKCSRAIARGNTH